MVAIIAGVVGAGCDGVSEGLHDRKQRGWVKVCALNVTRMIAMVTVFVVGEWVTKSGKLQNLQSDMLVGAVFVKGITEHGGGGGEVRCNMFIDAKEM